MTEPLNVVGGWVQGAQLKLRAYHANRSGCTAGPLVIVLPGMDRTMTSLAAWVDTVARVFETVLLELPGQGDSETPATADFDTLVAEVRAAVTNVTHLPVILVGESLGGLAALAIAADPPAILLATMVVDPPLTPAAQPHLAKGLRHAFTKYPNAPYLRAISQAVFGVGAAHGPVEHRTHMPLVSAVKTPTLLLTGDVHIDHPRAADMVARMVSDTDLAQIAASAGKAVRVRVIAGAGHAVLSDQPAAALAELQSFVTPLLGKRG